MQIKATEQASLYPSFDMLDQLHFKLIELEMAEPSCSESSWRLGKHFLDSYMLLFIAEGEGWLTVDGQFIELRSGVIYLGLPGQLVEAEVRGKGERGLYQIQFSVFSDGETSEESTHTLMKQMFMRMNDGAIRCSSPAAVNLLCQEIRQLMRDENGVRRYYGQIRFQELLYTMFSDMVHVLQANDPILPIEQVRQYIEQHYMEKITIQDMADVARMSSRHFMRLFKKMYGCSAMDYLTIYRIKQAQMMMRNDYSPRLKEVAACVGFQDEMYFRRKFKQISGLPPAAFIRNSKQRIVAVHSLGIGILLALQIVPYAAQADHPWTAYYRRKYETDKVTPLVEDEEGYLDQLKAIRPDYIIAVREEMSSSMLQRLNSLAPVCVLSQSEGDWREHLRCAAQFMNRPAAAEVWLERYDQKAAAVQSQLSKQIRQDRLIVLRVQGDVIQAMNPKTIASVFYSDLQLLAPEGIERLWHKHNLHIHDLAGLSIDRALVIVSEDVESKQTWAEMQQSEVWMGTKAVQNKRIDMLIPGVLLDYTAFTHELMLDEVLKLWQHRP
ncbi:AraC family transcriptional regulator [Paenibacillus amylolyticus]|uniref:AraC family transcriptional regulator n=1 Tax=Paenibacillus amylolyticus TaxID=1451 RepID=UPI003EB78EC3